MCQMPSCLLQLTALLPMKVSEITHHIHNVGVETCELTPSCAGILTDIGLSRCYMTVTLLWVCGHNIPVMSRRHCLTALSWSSGFCNLSTIFSYDFPSLRCRDGSADEPVGLGSGTPGSFWPVVALCNSPHLLPKDVFKWRVRAALMYR